MAFHSHGHALHLPSDFLLSVKQCELQLGTILRCDEGRRVHLWRPLRLGCSSAAHAICIAICIGLLCIGLSRWRRPADGGAPVPSAASGAAARTASAARLSSPLLTRSLDPRRGVHAYLPEGTSRQRALGVCLVDLRPHFT
jgi:hypothetical protein